MLKVFEKLVTELYTRQSYKEALAVATSMQSQLALAFTSGAADMLSKVEEHVRKYVCMYSMGMGMGEWTYDRMTGLKE